MSAPFILDEAFDAAPTPWRIRPDAPHVVVDRDGEDVVRVCGVSTSRDEDLALAALIVQLVNDHQGVQE